jgi:hypothetical protein
MAWIKMRTNLRTHPKVVGISDRLKVKVALVIGACHIVWSMADEHSTDGFLPGVTPARIDRETGLKGFAVELARVGWLEVEQDGVRLARYEEHNGETGKGRAETQKRVHRHRLRNENPLPAGNANVTPEPLPEEIRGEVTTTARAREPEPDTPDPNLDSVVSRFARWAGRPLRTDERRGISELVTWAEGEPSVTVAGQTVPLVALLPEAVEEGIRSATYNGPGPARQFVTAVIQRCIDQGVRPGQWVDSKAEKPKPAPKVRYGAM